MVVSKAAASGPIRVVARQKFSSKKNITGERNGANPRSTEPASAVVRPAGRGGAVTLVPRMGFGGLRRAHRSPSPPMVNIRIT